MGLKEGTVPKIQKEGKGLGIWRCATMAERQKTICTDRLPWISRINVAFTHIREEGYMM